MVRKLKHISIYFNAGGQSAFLILKIKTETMFTQLNFK